jgi:6-phosphofructokinase
MKDVCKYMAKRLYERRDRRQKQRVGASVYRNPYGIIVMSETAIPTDFEDYMDRKYVGLTGDEKKELEKFAENKKMVRGQTPDALRSAGLKIVSKVLQQYIRGVMGECDECALGPNIELECPETSDDYWKEFRVFTNEPRHLIRSMEPSVSDVAYGIRLGTMAADMALAGYTDCMVSQWLTEYVVVPLKLVVLGRKRVPKEGIFWKTVISKTRQIGVESLH